MDIENIGMEEELYWRCRYAEYKIMKLDNPKRIVIDLLDSSLRKGTDFNYDYELEVY